MLCLTSAPNHLPPLNGNNETIMKKIFWLFCLIILSESVFAQIIIEKSQETELYNGKHYYIHTIEAGQTVYSIAKAYDVTADEVLLINTFAREGIKPGQLLRIPVPETFKAEEETQQQSDVVTDSDTLYLLTYVADEDLLLTQLTARFKIGLSELYKYNPDFRKKEIVRKNDILRLPVISLDEILGYLTTKPQAQVLVLTSHQVRKGETLFAIGRKYGCSVSEIFSFNPEIEEKLKEGQKLWVPAQEQRISIHTSPPVPTSDCIKISEKRHYNVALLVPFYLEHSGSIVIDSQTRREQRKSFRSFGYIQFYEGFLLAINKMDFNNATISLKVYDISDNEDKINSLISRGLLDVDMIIGPFMRKPLEILNEWSQKNNVKILDIYLPNEVDYSLQNPNVMSAIPSISEQLEGILKYIKDFQTNKNVIVVYNANNNEQLLADKIKDLQHESLGYTVQFLPYGSGGITELVKMLHKEKNNIILNFTTNEVFLNNFLRSLFDYAETYPLTLFGIPSWLRFESIDLRYLNHFNTHFFSSQFVDYSSVGVNDFVREFQNTYLTDPSRLAFLGHDVAVYSLGLLTQFGTDFPYCVEHYTPELLSTGFVMERQKNNGQLQNIHVSIFEIIDFELFDSRRIPGSND